MRICRCRRALLCLRLVGLDEMQCRERSRDPVDDEFGDETRCSSIQRGPHAFAIRRIDDLKDIFGQLVLEPKRPGSL